MQAEHIVHFDDYLMLVDPTDTNLAPVMREHKHEVRSTALLKRRLKKGDRFVDCGAHWGYYTLLAASMVGESGRVYAFEPNLYIFSTLCLNVALNRFGNVHTIPIGLWESTAILEFVPEIGTTGGSHVVGIFQAPRKIPITYDEGETVAYYSETEPIMAAPLDDLFAPDEVDFLKVDCEGSDKMILKGAENILTKGNPSLMVESAPRTFLEELGYGLVEEFEEDQISFWEKR